MNYTCKVLAAADTMNPSRECFHLQIQYDSVSPSYLEMWHKGWFKVRFYQALSQLHHKFNNTCCQVTNRVWGLGSQFSHSHPGGCNCSSRPQGGLLKRWFISKQWRAKSILLLLQNAEVSQRHESCLFDCLSFWDYFPFCSIHTVNTGCTHSTQICTVKIHLLLSPPAYQLIFYIKI